MHKGSGEKMTLPKGAGTASPSGWHKATNLNTHYWRSFLGTSKRAYAYIPESDLKSQLRLHMGSVRSHKHRP